MPLKKAIVMFGFHQVNISQTEVAMILAFAPKVGVLGKLLISVLKMKFRGMLQELLDTNANYVENGTLNNVVKVTT